MDPYYPSSPPAIFSATKFYIGADFVYPKKSNDAVKITLLGNSAAFQGDLYAINPRTKEERKLFSNFDPPQVLDITSMFRPGDRVVFMFKSNEGFEANDKLPKYTGPNDDPKDPYYTDVHSDGNIYPERHYGHRWSITGESIAYPGQYEFGFEDVTGWGIPDPFKCSDMDFDDIVYLVKGLQIAGRQLTRRNLVW